MVTTRFKSLLFGLLFSLASIEGSIANAHHGIGALVDNDRRDNKDLRGETRKIAATGSNKWLRGRKIGDHVKKEVMKERDTMNLGGNCDHGRKRKLDLECELRGRGGLPSSVELVGFTPFTSDYHDPRIHPPKNN